MRAFVCLLIVLTAVTRAAVTVHAESVTLLCVSEKPAATASFTVDYDRSEVIYLDDDASPMWAVPAGITAGSIKWNASDPQWDTRRAMPPIEDRSRGHWPLPKQLSGTINRISGRIDAFSNYVTWRSTAQGKTYTIQYWLPPQDDVMCRRATQKF